MTGFVALLFAKSPGPHQKASPPLLALTPHVTQYNHTMAEQNLHENTVTEDRIQSLVRGIVGEFFTSNVGSTQHEQGQQFSSLDEEVNHRFRLPRSSIESPTLTDTSTDDLGAVVNAVTASRNQPNASSTPSPIGMSVPQVPRYNSLVNYGSRRQTSSGPGPRRQSGRNSNRHRSTAPSNARSSDRNECFLKDVCLLPSPAHCKVPRHEAKVQLQKRGLYIDAYTFDKRWEETMLCH